VRLTELGRFDLSKTFFLQTFQSLLTNKSVV
jgi:hypothetical protein